MKVLHVYRTYFPDTQGGLEEVIRQICLGASENGVQSKVFTLSDEPFPHRLPRVEAEVLRVRKTFEIASCGFALTGIRRFAKAVEWADIVHYHYPWPFSDLMYLVAGRSRPAVLTYHSDIVRQQFLLSLYKPLMRRYLGAMDRIVATSPNYFATSEVLGEFSEKVEIIPIGLNEPSYPAVDEQNRNLAVARERYGDNFFLFVGVLRYYKGLHILLDAIVGAPYKVVIVGAGPVESELRKQASELGLDNVIFAGFISDKEKMALFQLCRAVVFPSYLRSEAFGVTLLEGAMSSRPLISAEVGSGTSHVNIHGETGLVVPPSDSQALRKAMDQLYADAHKAREMGLNARRRYEELFTGSAMGKRYSDVYQSVLRERKAPANDHKGPELVFLHIPKTAGTSQRHTFTEYYGRENVFWVGRDCPGAIRRFPARLVGARPVMGGHKQLSFYPRRLDPLYCAVLRNPAERAISLFNYHTQLDRASTQEKRQDRERILATLLRDGLDPDSLVNSLRNCKTFRKKVANVQCAYLSRSGNTFQGVLETLRQQDVILGTLDQYELFHQRLGNLLEWPGQQAPTLNRSGKNSPSPDLEDPELLAVLREINEEDYKLWDFVTQEHQGLYVNVREPLERQRRLKRLQLKPWWARDARKNWRAVAGQLWPPRDGAPLSNPQDRILVGEKAGLLCLTPPGPHTNIVERLMLDSSCVSNREAVKTLGQGRVITRFKTGLLMGDRDAAQARSMMQDSRYFRFAVVSEPVSRLVELYVDMFVVRRNDMVKGSVPERIVATVQGHDRADTLEGISFREFVTCLVRRAPQEHPWLWAPQDLYLKGMPEYDKVYRQDQLHLLASDLLSRKGLSVHIPASAPAPGSAPKFAGQGMVSEGEYADSRPGALPTDVSQWRDKLVDRSLCEQILQYYDRDCTLYNARTDDEEAGQDSRRSAEPDV